MFSATAAPTPEPVAPAVAFADESLAEVAFNSTSPPAASTAAAERSRASVLTFAIVNPSEPATETPAAAPDFASLPKLAPACVSASMSSPPALPAADEEASLAAFASVIATPAPIAADPPVADPSATDFAAGVSDALNSNKPPELNEPAGNVAFADAFAIVTATAAATDTGPAEVEAEGVEVAPEPEPPFAAAAASAWPRSPAT
jgi:hypothetical protein